MYWVSLRGSKTKFLYFFFHRGIRKKKLGKSRIVRDGLPEDFLSKGKKTTGEGHIASPLPWFRGLTNILQAITLIILDSAF